MLCNILQIAVAQRSDGMGVWGPHRCRWCCRFPPVLTLSDLLSTGVYMLESLLASGSAAELVK